MTIAILAHDSRKELALQFCTAYSAILSKNTVIATGTTGRMLAQTTGLPVHCYLSGRLGGVQQITSRIACDEVDLVLFFRDPLKADAASITEQNLLRLRDMSDVSRRAMEESHLVSRDLLRSPETAAVLVKRDSSVSIMMNEDDHLRIQAVRTGDDLLSAAQACFCVDDALSRQNEFAFDQQLGYLTAFPTNAGTGMRASLLLHLPLLTRSKQMGNVGQMVAKVGLNIRGVYGEGAEALGNIYQISNQVTLGRTEQELITTVEAVGQRLTMMEQNLEEKALTTAKIETEDAVQRAFGILTHARILPRGEFYPMYSNLRLGATMGLLPLSVQKVDEVLDQVQDAHLCIYAGETLSGQALDAARADRVRELLGE